MSKLSNERIDIFRRLIERGNSSELERDLLAHIDALQAELKETQNLLWRAEVPDMVPTLQAEVARLREALERIRQSDRTISGMGSTSGAQESWWLYGTFGFIAHQALEHMPVPKEGE